jgi:hypothetical protein
MTVSQMMKRRGIQITDGFTDWILQGENEPQAITQGLSSKLPQVIKHGDFTNQAREPVSTLESPRAIALIILQACI